MTADLSAHGNLMGGVSKSTKSQRLRMSKKTKAKLDAVSERINEKRATTPDKKEPLAIKSERLEKDKVTVSQEKSQVKPDTEPIKVKSERINVPKENEPSQQQISFNKYELPTYGPGSEYNPNAGRQWNTNG